MLPICCLQQIGRFDCSSLIICEYFYFFTNCWNLAQYRVFCPLNRTKSRKISSEQNRKNPIFSNEEMCSKCSTPWRSSNFKMSVDSVKLSKKQSKKTHQRLEDKTKQKQRYLKNQIKSSNNNVVSRYSSS